MQQEVNWGKSTQLQNYIRLRLFQVNEVKTYYFYQLTATKGQMWLYDVYVVLCANLWSQSCINNNLGATPQQA